MSMSISEEMSKLHQQRLVDDQRRRGEQIRQLVDAQVTALVAGGCILGRFDKIIMASAAAEVLYPAVPVDMPSWGA